MVVAINRAADLIASEKAIRVLWMHWPAARRVLTPEWPACGPLRRIARSAATLRTP
jgi:hypothetical protein